MRAGDGRPDDVEFLDVGPTDRPTQSLGGSRRGPRSIALLLAGLAVALVVVVVVRNGDKPSTATASRPPKSPSSAPATTTAAPTPEPVHPVVVTHVGRPLLGVRAGWELFGRGAGVVVRIQPAAGLVTRSVIPALTSDGPVSFLVARDRAIVRPLDLVPGYVVPDGRAARMISGRLGLGGPMLPGPDGRHVWVQSEDRHPAMTLATLDGTQTGPTIVVPDYSSAVGATPDGAGYLLFTGTGGVYDAHPGGLRRITTGSLVAVGPSGWLVVECDARHRCESVVVDRADGSRRVLSGELAADVPPGVIAADGSAAAVYDVGPGGLTRLYLVDLRSGVERRVDVSVASGADDGALGWSPDSRWLFVLDASSRLVAVNARTDHVTHLGTALPRLLQIAIRNR